MRKIYPNTDEYRKCLESLVEMRFTDVLRKIKDKPYCPLIVMNEGNDNDVVDGVQVVRYESNNGFTLFPL